MKSITIPSSVTEIGGYAFGCKNLRTCIIEGENHFENIVDWFDRNNGYYAQSIYAPVAVIEQYKADFDNYSWGSYTKPDVKFIPMGNFSYSGADNQFEMGLNDAKTLKLSLEGAEAVNGFQTDITLPAGLSIASTSGKLDVTLGTGKAASHVLTAAKVSGENKYRIIVYSSKNETFTDGTDLLNIAITSDATLKGGDITVGNTILTLEGDASFNPADVTITVPSFIGVETVTITPAESEVNLGKTLALTAEVTPAEAWEKTLKWTSSNTSVATVSADGVVTPVAKGTVTITATSTDGTNISGTATVTVTNYAQSFTLGQESLTIEEDETEQLNPTFAPANAEELGLSWSTTNASVAYVDEANVLHALTPGEVTVTATNAASGLTASINVTVTAVLYGDSNDDSAVAIDDITTDVKYILEQNPKPFSFKKADVNRDRNINIIDVSKTVTIVMSNSQSSSSVRRLRAASAMTGMEADDVTVGYEGRATMVIKLAQVSDITAIQGDINVPDGVEITNISLANSQGTDHIVDFAHISPFDVRFVIYSLSLDCLAENAPVIEVEMDCDRTFAERSAMVSNIYASDTNSNLHSFHPFNVMITDISGVADLNPDNVPANVDIYNFQGMCLKRNATADDIRALTPGLYIIGGEKVLVK